MNKKLILTIFFMISVLFLLWVDDEEKEIIDLGISPVHYNKSKLPGGWKLKKYLKNPKGINVEWVIEEGIKSVKLHSKSALSFIYKKANIDIKEYPIVSWKWKVDNILKDIDETTNEGDDHPIRIFFVFEPDNKKQTILFRIKRFLFLDLFHGHPVGGRFTEYLWSSNLQKGSIINDPNKPKQKLMVVEGGSEQLGKWLSYKRNLYEDFKKLYQEEPRTLIFIGILNDTDITGKEATSFISDLKFHKQKK